MNHRLLRHTAAAIAFTGCSWAALPAATVTVTGTVLHEHKGWGLMPAPYDRQMPTYADGSPAWGDATWLGSGTTVTPVMDAVCDAGFDVARVYLSPTLGRPDNTIDQLRLQDLKDHLTILKNKGITRYIVTVWTPPVHMKLPDHVRYGRYQGRDQYLDPAYADGQGYDFADFYVDALKGLRDAGFPAPLAVSIQNEPDVNPVYDGCVYDGADGQRAVYRTVVKQLRQKLTSAGFTQTAVQATEHCSFVNITSILGAASASGFAQMNGDAAFRDAVGAFCFHTYATAGTIRDLTAAMAFHGRDRWMTEYSTETGIRGELRPNSGNAQVDWMLNDVRRMAGDIVDLGCHYWCFWRGWHSSSAAGDQDLVYGSGQKSKAYYAFQRLWKTVKPGWKVMQMSDTDPDLRTDNSGLIASGSGDQWSAPVDLLGFQDAAGGRSCVMLVNNYASAKAIAPLGGLKGAVAEVYITDATRDGAKQAERTVTGGVLQGGELSLPPYSVTIVSTYSSTVAAQRPAVRAPGRHIGTSAAARRFDLTGRVLRRSADRRSIARPANTVK